MGSLYIDRIQTAFFNSSCGSFQENMTGYVFRCDGVRVEEKNSGVSGLFPGKKIEELSLTEVVRHVMTYGSPSVRGLIQEALKNNTGIFVDGAYVSFVKEKVMKTYIVEMDEVFRSTFLVKAESSKEAEDMAMDGRSGELVAREYKCPVEEYSTVLNTVEEYHPKNE